LSAWSVDFTPAFPAPLLIALAVAAAALAAVSLWLNPRGAFVRALALALLIAGLAGPSLVREDRKPLRDVVAVVVDRSASNRIGERSAQTDAAKAAVLEKLSKLDNVETRVVESPTDDPDNRGTELFATLRSALGDVPPERVGGAILITDGVVHDIPSSTAALGFNAPLHALITGHEGERNRRVELIEAPKFGIVGKSVTIRARVLDTHDNGEPVRLDVRRDGETLETLEAKVGDTIDVDAPIDHAGPNVFELEAEALPDDLTTLNHRAVASIEGVRDKLRVLLVSGEPHPGERMWRNLLKSDANIDLVHFTILRSPDKAVDAPINELSLIAFPVADVFGRRIHDFDLIIFDRYSKQSVVPRYYLDNIVTYVREGGALLIAAGPEFGTPDGLGNSPIGDIAPARPTGEEYDKPFRAQVSADGAKHPVTRPFALAPGAKPSWGEWFRAVGADVVGGDTVLEDEDKHPLLALSRVDKGRVALLLTDQMWLWARGYDGGGPHLELLRRLAHWLMKEPELEEEALRARTRGHDIVIERQSVKGDVGSVTLTAPDGKTSTVALAPAEPGLARAVVGAAADGLYRLSDGEHLALVNVGADNALEMQEVVSTLEHLRPLAEATGGAVERLAKRATDPVSVPSIVSMANSTSYAGTGFLGVKRAGASELIGVARAPLDVGFLALAALFGALTVAWLVEGGRLSRRPGAR